MIPDSPQFSSMRSLQRRWLVTGAAGFIGSHLVENLLRLGQEVVALDNLSTGRSLNLDSVRAGLPPHLEKNLHWRHGDIRDAAVCRDAALGVDIILHQAALGSVPRSIANPVATTDHNVNGFLNVLVAAKDAGVKRVVYASSSSVYGDHPELPKVEERTGNCLSPYAVSKAVNELHAQVFARCYGLQSIGLRYFNVFGPRQDPKGQYAAVIPLWTASLLAGEPVYINGDGETSRDFTHVDNVVAANLAAGTSQDSGAINQFYNIAAGGRTTLNELFRIIRDRLAIYRPEIAKSLPVYRDFRAGDVRHSHANIDKARRLLGYDIHVDVTTGLQRCVDWYAANPAT